MSQPQVSVVIPAYNAEKTLPLQLGALTAQVDAPDFETIVVDNGSADRTRHIADEWSHRLPLRVLDASNRPGASYARNRGIAAARGEVIAMCDADDWVSPGWVRALSTPAYTEDALVSGCYFWWATGSDLPAQETMESALLDNGMLWGQPYVGAGNFAARRSALVSVGGFDESFSGGAEDIDLSFRLLEHGHPFVLAKDSYIAYRQRSDARTIVRQYRRYQRERILLWKRARERRHDPGEVVSLRGAFRDLAHVPGLSVRARSGDRRSAEELRTRLGALEGNLRYRVLREKAQPQLMPARRR